MVKSRRWLDDDAPPEIRRLLQAACREAPPRRAVDRAVLVVGSAGAVGTATTTAISAAAKIASSSSSWVVAKWGAIAVFGLSVATGTTAAVRHYASTPAIGAAATRPIARVRSETVQRAVALAPDVTRSPLPLRVNEAPHRVVPLAGPPTVPAPVTASAAQSVITPPQNQEPRRGNPLRRVASVPVTAPASNSLSDPQLLEEMRFLDRGRAAMLSGQVRDAKRWLIEYRQSCPAQRLIPEALLLGMQTATRQGDMSGAAEIAREIWARFPNSPHAAKARDFLDASAQQPTDRSEGN